ncbi:hypothetical protein AB0I28_04450 [Phytomonospora sp. NPDC050363]|uniref:hypothetical protein n=1 Tax=Phytomonospora sp. NPDC050363 TaxID=3155642 RepID=UPI00340C43A4
MRRRKLLAGLALTPIAAVHAAPTPAGAVEALAGDLTRRDLAEGGASIAGAGREAVRWALSLGGGDRRLDHAVAVLADRVASALGDAGLADPREQHRLLDAAERVAVAPELRAHIRLDRASVLDACGDHAGAARHAEDALTGRLPAVQAANLRAGASRYRERAGDTDAAVAHVEAAERLWAAADPGDVPAWAVPVLGDAGHVPGVIGRAWLVLGRYRRAEEWLGEAAGAFGAGRVRGRAACLARRAHARLALGNLGGCDEDLGEAGVLAAGLGSAGVAEALGRVRRLRGVRR